MRASSLPRPARAAAAGLVAAVALLAVAGARADDPSSLRSEAERLEAANDAVATQSREALIELYALESRLKGAERRVEGLRARVAELDRQQASAKRRLAIAQRARSETEDQLAARLTALYKEGDVDPFEIFLGAESLADGVSALENLSRLAEQDRAIIEQAGATSRELEAALAELKARETELRGLLAEAEDAHASIAATRLERTAYLEGLARSRRLNEAEIAGLLERAAAAESRAQTLTQELPAAPADATATAAAGAALAAGRTIAVTATGYSLPGFTATGLPVGWGVAAVDPRVIPLGTRMIVPGYGEAIAADTGSAIQGTVIDLWFPTAAQAFAWGTRTVTITLL